MIRQTILEIALKAIMGDRAATHGKPEDSFTLIAEFWNVYLTFRKPGTLLAHDAATMMTLFKVARTILNPSHEDNYVDTAGYAGCAGELATEGKPMGMHNSPVVDTCNDTIPFGVRYTKFVTTLMEKNSILTWVHWSLIERIRLCMTQGQTIPESDVNQMNLLMKVFPQNQ